MKKYHYYVQVTTTYINTEDNKIWYTTEKNYVTAINNKTKMAHWKKGDLPLEMTKTQAENYCEGLIMNMFNAQIVMTYYTLDKKDNF